MAVKYYFYFLLVPFLKSIKMNIIQNTTEIEEKSSDLTSHLELPKIKKICSNRDVLCRSNNAVVCTLKYVNNSRVYKMFKNACYLFLSNMCDNPGEEFYILTSGTCEDHFGARRNNENKTETTTPLESTNDTTKTPVENNNEEATTPVETHNEETTTPVENNNDEATTIVDNSNDEATTPVDNANDEIITQLENNNEETTTAIDNSNGETTTVDNVNEAEATTVENSIDTVNDYETSANLEDIILRQGVTTPKPTEPITETETADGRPCPISCPKIYDPVCVNVNRGFGKYFKLFMFVNRCMYDLYYCKHPVEFDPPPNEDYDDGPGLSLQPSPLGMSYCAASRYLQFARFAEVTSSMAHYGWLTGSYRYSHIMEPHERLPGHG